MLGFVTFVLRMVLVLAIGGGLFVIVSLLRLSFKERSALAAQGYSARRGPPEPAHASRAQLQSIGDCQPSGHMASARLHESGRRRAPALLGGRLSRSARPTPASEMRSRSR